MQASTALRNGLLRLAASATVAAWASMGAPSIDFSWRCEPSRSRRRQPVLLGARMQLQPKRLDLQRLLFEAHVLEVGEYVDQELAVLVDGLGDGEGRGVIH